VPALDVPRVTLDQQQALLLVVLRRAGGNPVGYQELRDAGVEYPASVVSELELAGLALERCYEGPLADRRLLGVRLDVDDAADPSALDSDRAEAGRAMLSRVPRAVANYDARSAAEAGVEQARRAFAWLVAHASVRWLAPAALVAVAVTVAVLAISGLSGAGSANRASTRRAATQGPAAGASRARPAPPPRPGAPAPTQVSPTLAAQLESRGHALLQASEPAGAVPVLRQALAATGESLEGCLEPVSETCLTYAYALYDLGTALRLARQPAAAVQILENRMRIANQRSTVQNELELARQEAGQQLASAATPG
jgi:hypothetical protein